MPKARQTCTECSIRRQKCDKDLPCGRCQARGVAHLCTRVWPTTDAARVHRGTSRRIGRSTSSAPTHGDDDTELTRDGTAQDSIDPSFDTREQLGDNNGPSPICQDDMLGGALEDCDDSEGRPPANVPNTTVSMIDAIDLSGPYRIERLRPALRPPSGFPNVRATSIALLELHLPSLVQVWHLVDYHEKYLLWYHGCYHGPTFRAELGDALQRYDGSLPLEELNLQWVALLFSILAGSMACASNNMIANWGFFNAETSHLLKQWYDATLTCLNLAGYTRDHQIYAVHAMTTLSMSAHPLGCSDELTVLLGSALRIAQSLGLNRLHCRHGSEVADEGSDPQQRNKILQREVGRRLWSQLCVQDWFSLPSSGSQLISPSDFTTVKPSNRDHITMMLIPEVFPTYISYGNYLNDIAKLMAEHHVALSQSSTPYTRYEQVLAYDKSMRKLAKEIPNYFNVTTPIDPSWPTFISWARRSLTICFAHKIIMIHRTFIRMSFSNPAFEMTRNTCIAAAKTILKEAKQEQHEDGPLIWVDQAFCVAAGIVLCLDMMHRDKEESAHAVHKSLVQECIARLRKFHSSTVAVRGVRILGHVLWKEETMQTPINSTRKRGPPTGSHAEVGEKLLDIGKLLRTLSSSGSHGMHDSPALQSQHDVLYGQDGGRDFDGYHTLYSTPSQILPPQAGFSNDFLIGELLDF